MVNPYQGWFFSEVQKVQAELSNLELSDEDLDNVAGGFHACACI